MPPGGMFPKEVVWDVPSDKVSVREAFVRMTGVVTGKSDPTADNPV